MNQPIALQPAIPSLIDLSKAKLLLRGNYSDLKGLPSDLQDELGSLIAERDNKSNRWNFINGLKIIALENKETNSLYHALILYDDPNFGQKSQKKEVWQTPSLKDFAQAKFLLVGDYSKVDKLPQGLREAINPWIAYRDKQVIKSAIAHNMPDSLLLSLCSYTSADMGKRLAAYIKRESESPATLYKQVKDNMKRRDVISYESKLYLNDFYALTHTYKGYDFATEVLDPQDNSYPIKLKDIATRIIPFCAYVSAGAAIRYLVGNFKGNINTCSGRSMHRDLSHQTALIIAAQDNDLILAKLILDQGGSPYACDDKSFKTPLDWAARYGHDKMVSFLLNYKNAPRLEESHYHYWGDEGTSKNTLELFRTQPRVRDEDFMDLAAESPNLNVIAQLAFDARSDGFDLSEIAANYKDSKAAKFLTAPLLVLASYVGNQKIVDQILQVYPSLIKPMPEAKKALEYALENNHLPVVNKLLKRGAPAEPFLLRKEQYTADVQNLLKRHAFVERITTLWVSRKQINNTTLLSRIKAFWSYFWHKNSKLT